MKHNVKKEMFKIRVKDEEVIVTKDHSIICKKDNKLISIEPENITGDCELFNDGWTLDYNIESLGIQNEDVYDIEVDENHNFFGNNILVHNSGYIHFDKVVEKIIKDKFDSSYDELSNDDKHKAIDFMLEFINDEIQPIIDETVDFVLDKFNGFKKGFMGAKVEKIAKRGFWTAKKRYALLAIYDEGSYKIEKEKIAVTGIETVKSQTPDFAIKILEEALKKILKETEEDFQIFLKSQKSLFLERVLENPQEVCEVVKINNLVYDHDERGYFRINETGRRIGAPANSKGGITYNKLLEELQLGEYYQPIEEGMKCYISKMKVPNTLESDVIAFLDDAFLFDADIVKFIDGNYLWEKHIISPLKSIVESIDFSLVKKVSNLDDW
jgi:DNA polymerase elongation subunit (family B)